MDNLIADCISIFTQILMGFAPDYLGDPGFLMIGYTFACAFLLVVLVTFCQILASFARTMISWISKGG